MAAAPSDQTDTPLLWAADGQPRSRRYGDIYFSTADGLAESRAVFLQGCGLPEAWRGRRRFVVGELGFGTGLNIAALLELWRRERPAGGRLHIFSVEAHPLSREDAARALAAFPDVDWAATQLIARWPGSSRGVHRVEFPEVDAILDVAVMDAGEALAGWGGRADAWFLDGFSPALNPDMWSEALLAQVAARSAPGARAATFTVAGGVRRALAAAGFEWSKTPGFGRKRERLEARLPGQAAAEREHGPVAIIGAGIAGASAARAVRALGVEPVVFEAAAPGAGGSGNPAALVTPRLDAGLGAASRLFAQAFARAVQLFAELPDAVIAQGVLQLAANARDVARFETLITADLFEPGSLSLLAPEAASTRLGEAAPAALDQAQALVIEPAAVLSAWLPQPRRARVAHLERAEAGWRLRDEAGHVLMEAETVIVAAALDSRGLARDLALAPVRGQASWAEDLEWPTAVAWGGYAIPLRKGVLFGATHDRGDDGVDLRAADHARNLAQLAAAFPRLAGALDGAALHGRAAVRAVTPDRLPIAGRTAPGLFVLCGFGSRGFAHAPLLAEHVAALALGAPSPLPQPQAALVAPGRFAERAARRAPAQPRRRPYMDEASGDDLKEGPPR